MLTGKFKKLLYCSLNGELANNIAATADKSNKIPPADSNFKNRWISCNT